MSWWKMELLRMRDSKLGLLPEFRKVFGSTTLAYFRRDYSPLDVGSTAQAVAYLAIPAARGANLTGAATAALGADPLLALADATVAGLWAVTGLRRPKNPAAHDYTLRLVVVSGRQGGRPRRERHRVDPDRRRRGLHCRPGIPGASGHSSAQRPGAAILPLR